MWEMRKDVFAFLISGVNPFMPNFLKVFYFLIVRIATLGPNYCCYSQVFLASEEQAAGGDLLDLLLS